MEEGAWRAQSLHPRTPLRSLGRELGPQVYTKGQHGIIQVARWPALLDFVSEHVLHKVPHFIERLACKVAHFIECLACEVAHTIHGAPDGVTHLVHVRRERIACNARSHTASCC